MDGVSGQDNLAERLAEYLSRFPNGVDYTDMWVFVGRWIHGKLHEWEAQGLITSWNSGDRIASTEKLRRHFGKE